MNKTMRGLDAWLAENVMGWKEVGCCWRDPKRIQPYYQMQASVENWHPTTNIAQAFEVVEILKNEGYMFAIQNPVVNWHVWIYYGEQNEFHIEEGSLALALCQAAQKAWEAK